MKIEVGGEFRGVIKPISAVIRQQINGEYSCQVSIPVGDPLAEHFVVDAIVYLDDANGKEQMFRLAKPERSLYDLTAFGWHITHDLAQDIILDRNWVGKSGEEVWPELIQAGISEDRFTGSADIGTVANMRVVRTSILSAMIGDQDNSFVKRFGGELDRDNFSVNVRVALGEPRQYRISYKKNLTGLYITDDATVLANRVVATFLNENDSAILLPENYIDSDNIGNTAIPHAIRIHFDDIKVGDGYTLEEAQAEVRARVATLFDRGLDRPLLTVEIEFVQLRNTIEFADYAALETVLLGDTIDAVYEDYSWTSRVVEYDWDALHLRYDRIVLGDVRPTVSDMSGSIVSRAVELANESVREKASELTGSIAAAQSTADGKNTVYYSATAPAGGIYKVNDIWFDTDNDNKMYLWDGAMWAAVQWGENAIADLAIGNAKIANLDAGKITTGTLSAARVSIGASTQYQAESYKTWNDYAGMTWNEVIALVEG